MRRFYLGLLAAPLLALFFAAGASAAEESASEAIRTRAKELTDKGVAYGRAIGFCLQDNAVDKVERAKIAYVEVMLALHQAIREVAEMEFPDTTQGRGLKLAYEKFLKVQNDNCRTLGLDYLLIVEDAELTQTERREKLMQVVERQVAIEKPHVETLDAALKEVE